jgi:hypothetical protein
MQKKIIAMLILSVMSNVLLAMNPDATFQNAMKVSQATGDPIHVASLIAHGCNQTQIEQARMQNAQLMFVPGVHIDLVTFEQVLRGNGSHEHAIQTMLARARRSNEYLLNQ